MINNLVELTLTEPVLLLDSGALPAFCFRCKQAVKAQPKACDKRSPWNDKGLLGLIEGSDSFHSGLRE